MFSVYMFQEAMAHNKYIRISSRDKFMYEIVKLPCTIPIKIYGSIVHFIKNIEFALNGTEFEFNYQTSAYLLTEKFVQTANMKFNKFTHQYQMCTGQLSFYKWL